MDENKKKRLSDLVKPFKKLKIAIDIDGSLTNHLDFFRKLTNSGAFEIYIITARGENCRDFTEDWLKKNKIKYKELVMEQNKAVACLERNIILMFDNDIEELSLMHSAGVQVACLPDGTWEPSEIHPTPKDVQRWWNQVFKISKGFWDLNNPLAKKKKK